MQKQFTSYGLIVLFLLFFSVQFYLTIFGGFLWPFSSHRLFSQQPRNEKLIVQAVLEDTNGNTYVVHPGRVIPIEYCRTSGLVRNIYMNGTNEQKEQFVKYLLKRLNEAPWRAFDEMFKAIEPKDRASFKTLRFESHRVEFLDTLKVKSTEVLFP